MKDAVTLLVLNDKEEKDENDLELKIIIRLQFENDLEMMEWAADIFDKVRELVFLTQTSLKITFRNQIIVVNLAGQIRITQIHFHLIRPIDG